MLKNIEDAKGIKDTVGAILNENGPVVKPHEQKRYLVYTSAGDNSNVHRWCDGPRDFDVWVTYYGDEKGKLAEFADYYVQRKGGKFPNLLQDYRNHPEVFEKYERIMVSDDDIIISASALNRLFAMSHQLKLWIMQPAYQPMSRITIPITCQNPYTKLRFTNFVEMGCALFDREKLIKFLNVYDPFIICWGVDHWYIHIIGGAEANRIAICDEISCVNPYESTKGGAREVDHLQSADSGRTIWDQFAEQNEIPNSRFNFKEVARIPKPLWGIVTNAIPSFLGRLFGIIKAKYNHVPPARLARRPQRTGTIVRLENLKRS